MYIILSLHLKAEKASNTLIFTSGQNNSDIQARKES